MKVFKFGGASVKDAEGVKNLSFIVHEQQEQLIVVVSAMGKTTNLLETLCNAYFHKDPKTNSIMKELKSFHLAIVDSLFPLNDKVYKHLEELFTNLANILTSESSLCYDYEYDRIICFGEQDCSRRLQRRERLPWQPARSRCS